MSDDEQVLTKRMKERKKRRKKRLSPEPSSCSEGMSECEQAPNEANNDEAIENIKKKFIATIFGKIREYSTEIFGAAMIEAIQGITEYIQKIQEDDDILDEWIDDSWKRGMDPMEIKKRTQQLKDLIKELDKDVPIISEILDSGLNNEEKGRAVQLYDLLNSLPRLSVEYGAAKEALLTIMGKHPVLGEEQLEKCKQMEQIMNQNRPNKLTLRQRVYLSCYDEENMRILYDMVVRLESMAINDGDYAGIKDIIETALSLPIGKSIKPIVGPNDPEEKVIDFLVNLRSILDEEIYGMKDIKDYIIEMISTRISNPDVTGDVIAFEGPPGTGKTLFVKCISKALDVPMEIISLAGAHDPSYIEGFLSTYSKSTYGRLIGALKKIQYDNGIILWDEADKIDENRSTAISGPLIVIFDPEQNNKFKDKFLGDIAVDVSKLLHFITMNDRKSINFIAADRMDIIPVRALSLEEKIGAAKLKVIPEAMKKAGLNPDDVIFDNDDIIRYIIMKSQQEPGMRQHKRVLERIFKRINVLKRVSLKDGSTGKLELAYKVKDFKIPLRITKKIVDELYVEDQNGSSGFLSMFG